MDEAASSGVGAAAQVLDLHALKAFAPDRRVRRMLFESDQLARGVIMFVTVNPKMLGDGPHG
jgi:hypothetical protein